jgi:GH15 family glucan-1,4-alpha-glucosidase
MADSDKATPATQSSPGPRRPIPQQSALLQQPRGGQADARMGSVQSAVDAMLACQQDNGSLIASPDFAEYHYCWLRDGSFAAYALDRCGEHEAAARYHDWVNRTVRGIGRQIDTATESRRAGLAVNSHMLPPARFSLDGTAAADDWPNFQIDGYGTWLWALREHLRLAEAELPADMRHSVQRVAGYVAAFALDRCYDVWEENPHGVHTSTLACVYGGLSAAAGLLDEPWLRRRAREVQSRALMAANAAGRLCKSTVSSEVDASMIWLATPFALVDSQDPLFTAAVSEITAQLTLDGGIRRFPSDSFFGGGAWPVLTAWLGWHQAVTGDREAALASLAWVASHVDAHGRLGEQFGGDRRQPHMYREWVGRWGHPARDLLWSHAMHAVLSTELGTANGASANPGAADSGATDSTDNPTFLRR